MYSVHSHKHTICYHSVVVTSVTCLLFKYMYIQNIISYLVCLTTLMWCILCGCCHLLSSFYFYFVIWLCFKQNILYMHIAHTNLQNRHEYSIEYVEKEKQKRRHSWQKQNQTVENKWCNVLGKRISTAHQINEWVHDSHTYDLQHNMLERPNETRQISIYIHLGVHYNNVFVLRQR